ncbi:RICIN domain-containing protein [Streptomyces sp. NPDC029006]|uniref:ricin-type beta-trefoil lectin domain protein n=1 Tax=Streptomyces sp. NPDC029006 TaxID=3155467 RepID=UPI0033F89C81
MAVQPASALGQNPRTAPAPAPAADSYDGFDAKAAEQLRFDQCLMADGLRRGGPNVYGLASTSLPLPADQLHQKADRTYGTGTFAQAWEKDDDDGNTWVQKTQQTRQSWGDAVMGLDNYPGSPDDEDFFDKTGLIPWVYQSYSKSLDLMSPWYEPSPQADDKTKKAALAIGDPLYTSGGTSAEQEAWKLWKKNSGDIVPNQLFVPRVFADDARIFLASGGFPKTAPTPDTPEFRIAVEDLKTRFASCAWHDPIDPDRVLGKEVAQASAEWQQEIASQAAQRQQILSASSSATSALRDGTFALGKLLGQSWIADYSTRWLDYYSEGGLGWIRDGELEIQVPGAAGKCLDVQGAAKTNGTPVQVYTCNGGAAQRWELYYQSGYTLRNINSNKCLGMPSGASADGTKIQIRDCDSSKAQQWKFDVRSAGPLVNVASGKCVHLPTFDNSKDAVLSTCNGSAAQKFRIVAKTHTGNAPAKADVDKAKAAITAAQVEAKKQLAVVKAQLTTAQKAVTASDTALQAAYGIADTNGAPRGRGLLVGLQKDQVTKGAAAALTALEKAGETAEAATRAAAGDSATIAQRALAQAAQSRADFRKKAAEAAEWQAKAAADAAKMHRDNAKKDKETAEAKLAVAVKAEGDAKAAAADAHAKRLAAEAEEKTAKAEKENAAAKQAEAAEHRKSAESEATKAKDAKDKAEAAEKTAGDRRDDAVKAKDHAKEMRDDAWDAEQKADAARAKADAKQSYADKLESGDAADAARAAADEAYQHAEDAEAAAGRARSEANAATKAAADADAAATRAEAAAKRARSDADAAQAAKLRADAAVKTATSAAADAITAAQHAASEAKTAVKLADEAEQHAKDAKTEADGANAEAGKAVAAAAKAAGFAHVTAQAAVDAGKAAQQVAAPANDAIELGSPYVDTDSAAGLVVLTGQASKTIAEQQQAVADAHAKNAAAEADAAKNLADQAKGDAKEAYTHAANAAKYAADARTYSKEALGYAADAAKAAAAAQASLARTIDYDQQATDDAAAADKAAGNAEGYAKDARDSADAAELDAEAARSAAAQAEQDAKDARAAADRAGAAATEAEQAAKDAAKYAEEAEEAADRAEKAAKAKQIGDGTVTDERGSVGNVFYVIDHIEKIGSPEVVSKTDGCDHWWNHLAYRGNCTITSKITYKAVLSLYLCTAEGIDPQTLTCPSDATTYLGEVKTDELSQQVTHNITIAEWQDGVDPIDILFGSWIKCAQKFTSGGESGSWGGCAWASLDVASLFAGKIIRPIAEALRAVDAAFVTGIGVRDAFKALKAIEGIDAAAVAAIEREVELYEEVTTACTRNSFPGGTQVLMADGTRRPIRDVRVGDLVLATDPSSGHDRPEPVTDTYRHDTTHLVDITVAGVGVLTSTTGHRVYVDGRGWVHVSGLRVGERLRAADGSLRTVTALRDRSGITSQRVYDLTVDTLHTFFVRPQSGQAAEVLVHNCLNLVGDEGVEGAHTLRDHVNPPDGDMPAEAAKKGRATKWNDQDTAVKSTQAAFENWMKKKSNVKRLEKWLSDQSHKKSFDPRDDLLQIEWELRDQGSLGRVWIKDGPQGVPTGNKVVIQLKYAPKHKPSRYVVYTSFPK